MRAALLACCALLGSGCAAQLKYTERWKLEPGTTPRTVSLEVIDERPADQGGENPRQIGIVRGGYGNPAPFELEQKELLVEQVRKALVDALHGAGLEASLKAPVTLKARVKRFWMDGYVGYAAQVEVQLDLVGSDGAALWTKKVEGHEAGAVFSFGAASELLNVALAHLASDAKARLEEDELQKLVP